MRPRDLDKETWSQYQNEFSYKGWTLFVEYASGEVSISLTTRNGSCEFGLNRELWNRVVDWINSDNKELDDLDTKWSFIKWNGMIVFRKEGDIQFSASGDAIKELCDWYDKDQTQI